MPLILFVFPGNQNRSDHIVEALLQWLPEHTSYANDFAHRMRFGNLGEWAAVAERAREAA